MPAKRLGVQGPDARTARSAPAYFPPKDEPLRGLVKPGSVRVVAAGKIGRGRGPLHPGRVAAAPRPRRATRRQSLAPQVFCTVDVLCDARQGFDGRS